MHARRLGRGLPVMVALVAGLLGTPVAHAADAQTIYVSTAGNDWVANSADTPWRTIEHAVRHAGAGDTIIVRGGTYQEVVGYGAAKGTADAPIRLQAQPGERVVIVGILALKGADYWIVQGINVTRDPALPRHEALVFFFGGTGWQFLDAEVWGNNGVSNIMVSGTTPEGVASNYLIAGNCVHDNVAVGDGPMRDHNIYIFSGYNAGPGVIERNILFNARNGANIKAVGATAASATANLTIRYNTMVRAPAGVVVGYRSHNIRMERNLVGIRWGAASSYVAAYVANHLNASGISSVGLAVWGYKKAVMATNNSTRRIGATGTVWVKPAFDNTASCAGFHPTDPVSSAYGRYAP